MAEQPPPAGAASKGRILAVDDNPALLEGLSSALALMGFEVQTALSGEEALARLAHERFDCVVLDRLMPGIGGDETCRRIRATPGLRELPLVMLTALDDRQALIEGLSVGADDYVAKSADLDVLEARVLTQIRRKQSQDENRRIREQLAAHELEMVEARAARTLAETRAALLQDLERKNRELEAFNYSVSHDLRAPLRSIEGFSQLLMEEHAQQLDERGLDYLARVRGAARRMSALIDALLELSRVGRTEIRRQRVDLGELAGPILAGLARSAPERALQAQVAERLVVSADPQLVSIALENLLGNAWKFTARAQIARIELGREEGAEPVFFVRDNGIGFDMARASRLFAPFQRLHAQQDFPGTGIGLATVARIVDRHGGRIWVEASPGSGAIFRFTLPEPDLA